MRKHQRFKKSVLLLSAKACEVTKNIESLGTLTDLDPMQRKHRLRTPLMVRVILTVARWW